ncbi:MAG: DNA polymerase III subunit epsilon [Hyphomicrobiaceae bacterium]
MLREIVLDTETTGLNAKAGDRLIEIGCVELLDRRPTGLEYHAFIFPEDRDVHPDAEAIHGISMKFLEGKPVFRDVADPFLAFIGSAPLVIHNAPFDVGFINMELERLGRTPLANEIIDTLALAKRKHPAGPNTLDGLCKRYGIDNSIRTKHGAIVDSLLLAEVYVELLGIKQSTLGLDQQSNARTRAVQGTVNYGARPRPLKPRLSSTDRERHAALVASLGPDAFWLKP